MGQALSIFKPSTSDEPSQEASSTSSIPSISSTSSQDLPNNSRFSPEKQREMMFVLYGLGIICVITLFFMLFIGVRCMFGKPLPPVAPSMSNHVSTPASTTVTSSSAVAKPSATSTGVTTTTTVAPTPASTSSVPNAKTN